MPSDALRDLFSKEVLSSLDLHRNILSVDNFFSFENMYKF